MLLVFVVISKPHTPAAVTGALLKAASSVRCRARRSSRLNAPASLSPSTRTFTRFVINQKLGRTCVSCKKKDATRWTALEDGLLICEVCVYKGTAADALQDGFERALKGIIDDTLAPTHKDTAVCVYGCATSPNWLTFAKSDRPAHSYYVSPPRLHKLIAQLCMDHDYLLKKRNGKEHPDRECDACSGRSTIRWHEHRGAVGNSAAEKC